MKVTIIYDGNCPFCSFYVRYVHLKRAAGDIRLIDARQGGAEVEEVRRRNLSLDDGMVLKLDEEYYHGESAFQRVAMMSSRSSWFNRANYLLFSSQRSSTIAYPILRAMRNLTLKILGRSELGY